MELIYRQRGQFFLKKELLAEIHKSFSFAKEKIETHSFVKKIIYRMHINSAFLFLQKTVNDPNFVHLSTDEQNNIKNELKNHKDFLNSL